MDLDAEIEKMADLLFEYNLAKMTNQSEEIINATKEKYKIQFNKVMDLKKLTETNDTESKK